MKKYFSTQKLWFKIITIVVLCLFYLNTVSWALPSSGSVPYTNTLQVQSIFKPILDVIGWEYETQLKIETALIRTIVTKDAKESYLEINDIFDRWYSAICGKKKKQKKRLKKRLLDIVSNPAREGDLVKLEVELLHGPHEGRKFLITSSRIRIIKIQQNDSEKVSEQPEIELKAGEKFVTSFDGTQICYEVIGDGDIPIVFLHYWNGSKERWHRFIKLMEKDKFFCDRVKFILIDVRGFGKSELKGKDWRKRRKRVKTLFGTNRLLWRDYFRYCAYDVKKVLNELGIGRRKKTKKFHLVGHSLGGMIGMQFEMDYPDLVESLAFVHTTADPIATFSPAKIIPGANWLIKQILKRIGWSSEKITDMLGNFLEGEIEDNLWENIDRMKIKSLEQLMNNPLFKPIFMRLLKSIVMDGEDEEIVNEVLEDFKNTHPKVILYTFFAMVALKIKKKDIKERIKNPVFVVRGVWDLVVGRKSKWSQHINDLRGIEIVKGKHMSPQEYPEELLKVLTEFYEGVIGAPPAKRQIGKLAEAFIDTLRFTTRMKTEAEVDVYKGGTEEKIGKLRLTKKKRVDPVLTAKKGIMKMKFKQERYRDLALFILNMLKKPPPNFYTFNVPIKDLFGFASFDHNLIAIYKKFTKNPVALFHEIGEYLIASKRLRLKFDNEKLIVFIDGDKTKPITLSPDTLEFIEEEVREEEGWEEGWQKDPHYLLRVLQREIFGEEDEELTRQIRIVAAQKGLRTQYRALLEKLQFMRIFVKRVLFVSSASTFWLIGSWVSLWLSKSMTLLGNIEGWVNWLRNPSDRGIKKSPEEYNYMLLKTYGWLLFKYSEWLFESRKPIKVPIEPDEIRLGDDDKVFEEVPPAQGEITEGEEVILDIDVSKIRNALYFIREDEAAGFLMGRTIFKTVALEQDPDSPFVFVSPDANGMKYSFASIAIGEDEENGKVVTIYLNKNLVTSWHETEGDFRKKEALEALVAETLIYAAYKDNLENTSQTIEIKKKVKHVQLLLSGLGEIGASGLDDLKKWETYMYWHKLANIARIQEIPNPQGITRWILTRTMRNLHKLSQIHLNFFFFLDSLVMSYFIMHPNKVSFPIKFIERRLNKVIAYTSVLRGYFLNYVYKSVHSGFPNKFERYVKYNYYWLLEAGFSGRTAGWVISFANRRVDNLETGFIPIIGDQSRHYNMYIRDGREGEFDFTRYASRRNVQEYVDHYKKEAEGEIINRDTRKDWARGEFIRAVKDYASGRRFRSLSSLGRGVHSLQDIPAHVDFDTGRYGTIIHHPDFDNPGKDLIGLDKDGNPVFINGTRRIELTRYISVAYYKAYLRVIDFIDEERIKNAHDIDLEKKIEEELKKVWELVDSLIKVSQVLLHLPANKEEALTALTGQISEKELEMLKWLIGKSSGLFVRDVPEEKTEATVGGASGPEQKVENEETEEAEVRKTPAGEITERQEVKNIKKKIKTTSKKTLSLFSTAGKQLLEVLAAQGPEDKKVPIDIVVDLSLISKEDLYENMETWAYLILLCKDITNVNFIFEKYPGLAKGQRLPDHLEKEIENAPEVDEVLSLLKRTVKDKAVFFDITKDEVKELTNNRITDARSSVGEDDEKPVEAPITSKAFLKWARAEEVELAKNQYPVAMEGSTIDHDDKVPLRDFGSALAVALAKASLVLAKRRVDRNYPNLKAELLIKLNDLYDVIRPDLPPDKNDMRISEVILEAMIADESSRRLNRAIDLYLPSFTRMPVKMLRSFHDNIQEFLQFA